MHERVTQLQHFQGFQLNVIVPVVDADGVVAAASGGGIAGCQRLEGRAALVPRRRFRQQFPSTTVALQ